MHKRRFVTWSRRMTADPMLLVGVLGLGALSLTLILEHFAGYQPCSLCWVQRCALSIVIITALTARALPVWPSSSRFRKLVPRGVVTQRIAATITVLFSLVGLAAAIRHLYIGAHVEITSCAPSFEMIRVLYGPFERVVLAFSGTAKDCADVSDLLFIPVPAWSALLFLIAGTLGVVHLCSPRRLNRG